MFVRNKYQKSAVGISDNDKLNCMTFFNRAS